MITIGCEARDQYKRVVIVLDICDNVVWTTRGYYHITKLFAVK